MFLSFVLHILTRFVSELNVISDLKFTLTYDNLNHDGPIVMDLNCHEYHHYEPKIIGWETPIEDMYPYLDEEEFKKNMYIKPLKTKDGRFYPSFDSGEWKE